MYLKNILIVLFAMSAAYSLHAQPDKSDAKTSQQSISFYYYPATLHMYSNMFDNFFNGGEEPYETYFGDYGYQAVGYDPKYLGVFALEYRHTLADKLQLNIHLGCELSNKQWDLYDSPNGPHTKRIFDYRITTMPGVNFTYLERKKFRMYVSAYFGLEYAHRSLKYVDKNERNHLYFAGQVNPLCFDINITKTLSLDFGLGFGTLGIMRLGLSHHF